MEEKYKKFLENLTKKTEHQNLSLKFTGERFVPFCPELANLFQEHIIRYMFSCQFIKNKIVLDAGCGTGYGSYLLAQKGAKSVLGIDTSKEAITFCKNNFKINNVQFKEDDCTNPKVSDSSIDVVIAFEILEHLKNPEQFLSHAKRILKNNGLLILSTPNKKTYNSVNPFHEKEYSREELEEFLKTKFEYVSIFHQSYPSTLAIFDSKSNSTIQELDVEGTKSDQNDSALYFLAICSDSKLPHYSSKLFLFDEDTILLKNFPILQKQVRLLDNELTERDATYSQLKKEFEERSKWALDLNNEIEERKKQIIHYQNESQQKDTLLEQLQADLKEKDTLLEQLQADLKEKDTLLEQLQADLKEKDTLLEQLQADLK
ncbi:MAG: methyltransferase domain-containing protein, partial [Nitrosopumilus sp.]|uniref:class I SAM-dependent methyltransferase n=1 Tax=Nitrosopumilus sp. TaxID=2024843 RepID=UPI00247D29C8